MENTKNIIEALHRIGLEIGPIDAFGPHECIHDRIDRAKRRGEPAPSRDEHLWQVMEQELVTKEWQERRPWDPPELK